MSILSRMSVSSNRLSTEKFPSLVRLSAQESDKGNELQDPYDIWPKVGKRDIGPYKHLCEIDAQSISAERKPNYVFLNRRLRYVSSMLCLKLISLFLRFYLFIIYAFVLFRILITKLASVKLQRLTHQEKLAFWINVYNSCMMNVCIKFYVYISCSNYNMLERYFFTLNIRIRHISNMESPKIQRQ